VAIIAILAALLLPALNKGKHRAQGIQCLGNQRQLCAAWRMYADDNADRLTLAYPGFPHSYEWLPDDNTSGPGNTYDDPDTTVKLSPLWAYCPAVGIWKCPANRAKTWSWSAGDFFPVAHSMAMNAFMGGEGGAMA